MSYSRRDLMQHIESNLNGLTDLSFTARCDIAEVIRDALDANHYDAPEVSYNSDAWDVVNGGEFNAVYVDVDFSECKNSQECVTLEANEILRDAYYSDLSNVLTSLACAMEEVFTLSGDAFPGADQYYVDEISVTSGCALGHITHDYEFDIQGDDVIASVMVWLAHGQLYFKLFDMEFTAELIKLEEV